jgi:hypothetical protein
VYTLDRQRPGARFLTHRRDGHMHPAAELVDDLIEVCAADRGPLGRLQHRAKARRGEVDR